MRFMIKISENFLMEAILKTFGVAPEKAFVDVAAESFDVQMGIWFKDSFPISEVSAIGPSEWPWWGGLGVKLHRHGIGVVGSSDNVVNIQFKTPQKATAVVSVDCSQLWISLAEPAEFMKTISDAAKIPISDHLPF